MTDIDLATRLETISSDLRNLVGDHLKLIAYADALKSEAAFIRDPQEAKESEFEFQKAALVARGLDPKLHIPVPATPSEVTDQETMAADGIEPTTAVEIEPEVDTTTDDGTYAQPLGDLTKSEGNA